MQNPLRQVCMLDMNGKDTDNLQKTAISCYPSLAQ